jgi:hypothetical protein
MSDVLYDPSVISPNGKVYKVMEAESRMTFTIPDLEAQIARLTEILEKAKVLDKVE